jgi:putative transposase
LKQQDNALADFSWQRGYAVFSISHTHVEALGAYIDNQAEHHRKRTFEEEYLDLLERAGVEFDPAYVLD